MNNPLSSFDINDPHLPKAIKEDAMSSGGYPYEHKLDRDIYQERIEGLQRQLVRLQEHMGTSGERLVVIFEGRDAAGKGGAIKTVREHLNPRKVRIAALPKPSDREQTEWYFQRYVAHLPAAGEATLFDRSWYNRGGVEQVMGYASADQVERFLSEAPEFEKRLTNDGIHLIKFWLSIGQEMQIKRFHARRHDPLKVWKLSPIDLEALGKWDDYSAARDQILRRTDSEHAPWTIIRANDKRRARIAVIQTILSHFDFEGKDQELIGDIDPQIRMSGSKFVSLPEIE